MNNDSLEEMAREIVVHPIYFNSTTDWTREMIRRIADTLRTVQKETRSKTRKEDAEIAKEYGSTVNKDKWSITHTMAGERIAQAILKKEEEEHG